MALELNMFNLQRYPWGFDDEELSTLNWVEDFVFDDNSDDFLIAKYGSFLIDDEHKYDVFEFDDLCPSND